MWKLFALLAICNFVFATDNLGDERLGKGMADSQTLCKNQKVEMIITNFLRNWRTKKEETT